MLYRSRTNENAHVRTGNPSPWSEMTAAEADVFGGASSRSCSKLSIRDNIEESRSRSAEDRRVPSREEARSTSSISLRAPITFAIILCLRFVVTSGLPRFCLCIWTWNPTLVDYCTETHGARLFTNVPLPLRADAPRCRFASSGVSIPGA